MHKLKLHFSVCQLYTGFHHLWWASHSLRCMCSAIKRVIVHRESTCWVWWGSISVFSWIVYSGRRLQRHLPVWSIRCCVCDQITILNISLYSFVWLCHWLLWRWVTQDHLHNTCFCKTCFFFFWQKQRIEKADCFATHTKYIPKSKSQMIWW